MAGMRPLVFVAMMAVGSACMSTEGLGPGPYAAAESADQCGERDLDGVVAAAGPDGYDYLFCTVECPPDGAQGCPLAEFVAMYHPELTIECVGKDQVCALVAVDTCPEDMRRFESEAGELCFFADEA